MRVEVGILRLTHASLILHVWFYTCTAPLCLRVYNFRWWRISGWHEISRHTLSEHALARLFVERYQIWFCSTTLCHDCSEFSQTPLIRTSLIRLPRHPELTIFDNDMKWKLDYTWRSKYPRPWRFLSIFGTFLPIFGSFLYWYMFFSIKVMIL